MPLPTLMQKYVPQYSDLTKAIKSGNLKLFNETLANQQNFFIKTGIYLIIEKSKILTYRNLIKKM
jgi:hypothetical protein